MLSLPSQEAAAALHRKQVVCPITYIQLLVSVLMALSAVWVQVPWIEKLALKPGSESP